MEELFSVAQKIIGQSRQILIAGHQDPDADSLGSSLALKLALENLGKKTEVVVQTPLAPNLKFLLDFGRIRNSVDWEKSDLIIGLDYGNIKRLDILDFNPQSEINFLTFDHHLPDNQKELKIIRPDFSSTSELIFYFLKYLKVPFSPGLAFCLLAGIFDDTDGFRHSTTSSQTLETAAELLKKGVSLTKIAKNIRQKDLTGETKLWSRTLEKIQIDPDSGLLAIFFSSEELKDFPDDFVKSPILNLLAGAPEARAVLFLQEKNGGWEGSLRSQKEKEVNVAELAKIFGGGGHPLAAGFKTTEAPEIVTEKIKTALKNLNG